MKRTLLTDGIRPFPGKKTMLYEVGNDVFLAIRRLGKHRVTEGIDSELNLILGTKYLILMAFFFNFVTNKPFIPIKNNSTTKQWTQITMKISTFQQLTLHGKHTKAK